MSDTASSLTDNDILFSVFEYDLAFRANSHEITTFFTKGINAEVIKYLKNDQPLKRNEDPFFKYYQGELGTVDVKITDTIVRPTPAILIYDEILIK